MYKIVILRDVIFDDFGQLLEEKFYGYGIVGPGGLLSDVYLTLEDARRACKRLNEPTARTDLDEEPEEQPNVGMRP